MYNSFFLGIFIRLKDLMAFIYKNSSLKSIIDRIIGLTLSSIDSSFSLSMFIKESLLIENSFSYKLYARLVDLGSSILRRFHELIKTSRSSSIIHYCFEKLLRTNLVRSIIGFWGIWYQHLCPINLLWTSLPWKNGENYNAIYSNTSGFIVSLFTQYAWFIINAFSSCNNPL